MTDPKILTDTELVEAVAREVMGFERIGWAPFAYYAYGQGLFNPLTDANNTQMIKNKLREMGWTLRIDITPDRSVYVEILNSEYEFNVWADTEARAICEASIKAMEGK